MSDLITHPCEISEVTVLDDLRLNILSVAIVIHLLWASYQIRKIAGCACAGNAGNVFPRRRFQRKPIVGDPGMHHGTCVTHVPWCMSGSLTYGDGENVPGIPGACAPAILRIWQEAHGLLAHPYGKSIVSIPVGWFTNSSVWYNNSTPTPPRRIGKLSVCHSNSAEGKPIR